MERRLNEWRGSSPCLLNLDPFSHPLMAGWIHVQCDFDSAIYWIQKNSSRQQIHPSIHPIFHQLNHSACQPSSRQTTHLFGASRDRRRRLVASLVGHALEVVGCESVEVTRLLLEYGNSEVSEHETQSGWNLELIHSLADCSTRWANDWTCFRAEECRSDLEHMRWPR